MADVVIEKLCRSCERLLPVASFYKQTTARDGYEYRCKECHRQSKRMPRPEAPEGFRVCSFCKVVAPLQSFRRWSWRCSKCVAEYKRGHRPKGAEARAHRRAMYDANRVQILEQRRCIREKVRVDVLRRYGGSCACCGETEPRFLALDHINRDGAQHRREIGCSNSLKIYQWVQRHGYPKDRFRILCHNCNFASFKNDGICPHQEVRLALVG